MKAISNRLKLKIFTIFLICITPIINEPFGIDTNTVLVFIFPFLFISITIDEIKIEEEQKKIVKEKDAEIKSLEYKITQLERNNNI